MTGVDVYRHDRKSTAVYGVCNRCSYDRRRWGQGVGASVVRICMNAPVRPDLPTLQLRKCMFSCLLPEISNNNTHARRSCDSIELIILARSHMTATSRCRKFPFDFSSLLFTESIAVMHLYNPHFPQSENLRSHCFSLRQMSLPSTFAGEIRSVRHIAQVRR